MDIPGREFLDKYWTTLNMNFTDAWLDLILLIAILSSVLGDSGPYGFDLSSDWEVFPFFCNGSNVVNDVKNVHNVSLFL